MIWEYGTIPLEIFVAIFLVLIIEIPLALILSARISDLIEWIKRHETD